MGFLKQFSQNFVGILSMANHDFCPWANRYVYWLKDPVGWFVLATVASMIVGAFLSPLGWMIAAGLAGVLVLGLGFPWIAVRAVHCDLSPVDPEIHERDDSFLQLAVRNRLPIPLMGLMIEEYFTSKSVHDDPLRDERVPDVGLSTVPAFSTATYRLPICPEYRGHYPAGRPKISCSFPFGIWTARVPLLDAQPVVVWPLLVPLSSEVEISGSQSADVGAGQRPSTQGDFMGVRDFRRGDSLRSIHWVQTARLDSLIVCERGGPQKQAIELCLDTAACRGTPAERRENLAWRVRVAASLIDLVVSRHFPFRFIVDRKLEIASQAALGRKRAWEILARIPLDGLTDSPTDLGQPNNSNWAQSGSGAQPGTESCVDLGPCNSTRIVIDAWTTEGNRCSAEWIRVAFQQPGDSVRRSQQQQTRLINLDEDIKLQLNQLLMEASRESYAA